MSARATHIHMARVYLGQARAARRHPDWHATLLKWAAKRRQQAARSEVQGRLFA